ncbi:hypothetical protein [Spirosoma harenae]
MKRKISPRVPFSTLLQIGNLSEKLGLSQAVVIEKAIDYFHADYERTRLAKLRLEREIIDAEIKRLEGKNLAGHSL